MENYDSNLFAQLVALFCMIIAMLMVIGRMDLAKKFAAWAILLAPRTLLFLMETILGERNKKRRRKK